MSRNAALPGVGPAMEVTGQPGEKLHMDSANVPNAEFFEHAKMMIRIIGVNIGMSFFLVMLDGSDSTFHGYRGAVDEARRGFRGNQNTLKKQLHCPVYHREVRGWMAEDVAIRNAAKRSRVNIFGHEWNCPTWKYVEPVKDAQGDTIRLQNSLTSPRRLHGEHTQDWEDIATESIEDNAFAIVTAKKQAAAINKKYPTNPLTWRDLISLPMPPGVKMTLEDPAVVEVMEEEAETPPRS